MEKNINNFPVVVEDLVVIDSVFPQPYPFGFRNSEINEYFERFPNFKSYTMHPMSSGENAWFEHGYGVDEDTFNKNKEAYLKYYPENKDKVKYLYPNRIYNIKLAYSFFLAETHTLLPFYEKHQIDFVFVLYPGGAFGLNFKGSDNMLHEIFSSKCFKKVIVTSNATYNYLIKKKLCEPEKIEFLCISVQFTEKDILEKKYYKKDKDTLDICFVAAKYSQYGVDKGYDLFIEIAKKLVEKYDDIYFHVVGGFDEHEIDVSEIKEKIKFYGFQRPDFLVKFYSQMDVFLSPNRASELYPGNFDGFPLGADAGFHGVALFVTDELEQNIYFEDGESIVIIKSDIDDILTKIIYFIHIQTSYINSQKNVKMQ